MIAFLLANWKGLAGAAAAFALSWMLHTLDVHRIEARQEKQIASLRIAMTDACNQVQETTRKVSHDYQTKLASLNARLADAHRLHDSQCVTVTRSAAAGHDGAASADKLAGRSASGDRRISANRIIEIVGKGEKYRLQLLSCQSFVSLTQEAGKGNR